MTKLALVIANKNYSSWSMRPWVLMREAGISFEEIQLKFDHEGRVHGAERYSPTSQVPVLLVDGAPLWDSLAICETLAELFPDRRLWPAEVRSRALARSICAEMHSGFRDLRVALPMNIRANLPGKGMSPAAQKDIDRICGIWKDCRGQFGAGGTMLFGRFGIPDAYFAPVVARFATYAVPLPSEAREYANAVGNLAAVRQWMDDARRETDLVAASEPYAK